MNEHVLVIVEQGEDFFVEHPPGCRMVRLWRDQRRCIDWADGKSGDNFGDTEWRRAREAVKLDV